MKKFYTLISFVDDAGNTNSIALRIKAKNWLEAEVIAERFQWRFCRFNEEFASVFVVGAPYSSFDWRCM